MPKFSVKKPYTVLVGVIALLVFGFVTFSKLSTDLLPEMELPYVVVVTTYPGAAPERVESQVTEVLESSLGTVNGVENLTSTSSENYSMLTLEFSEGTNMDSAMINLSTALDQVTLPDKCGKPMVIKSGRYGKFVACSGFPECRNAHPIVKDTGGICPLCGGHMLLRKSAKGRIYYGCSKYPTCNFMTWDEPVPEKCPQCGNTLYKKKGQLYCAKEGCGFEKPVEKK